MPTQTSQAPEATAARTRLSFLSWIRLALLDRLAGSGGATNNSTETLSGPSLLRKHLNVALLILSSARGPAFFVVSVRWRRGSTPSTRQPWTPSPRGRDEMGRRPRPRPAARRAPPAARPEWPSPSCQIPRPEDQAVHRRQSSTKIFLDVEPAAPLPAVMSKPNPSSSLASSSAVHDCEAGAPSQNALPPS